MKKFVLAVLLACAAVDASAANAFLVRCEAGTSVTGRFIYVGTYTYGGQEFQQSFTSYCPSFIQVE